jgi:hypothetical protein
VSPVATRVRGVIAAACRRWCLQRRAVCTEHGGNGEGTQTLRVCAARRGEGRRYGAPIRRDRWSGESGVAAGHIDPLWGTVGQAPWRPLTGKGHIPSDLVVDHWTSDGESISRRDVLLLHDVWATSNRFSSNKMTSTISTVEVFITTSCGIWLFPRGVRVTDAAIRQWGRKGGQVYAHQQRRQRPKPGDIWPVDERFLTIKGARHDLWRAVDRVLNSQGALCRMSA